MTDRERKKLEEQIRNCGLTYAELCRLDPRGELGVEWLKKFIAKPGARIRNPGVHSIAALRRALRQLNKEVKDEIQE